MINKGQDIEKLVQQTFSDFEPDVHPDVWMNIQQSLTTVPQPSSSASAGSSASGKVSGLFSKLNAVTVISASVALTSIIAGLIYFTSAETETSKANQQKNSIISETVTSPPGDITTENTPALSQEASSVSSNNNSQPGTSFSLNNITPGEENLNHENFSANDFVEPAPKELNKIPALEVAAPEQPAIMNQADNSSSIVNNDVQDVETENFNDEPENEPEPSTVSEPPAEIIEKASLGIITNVITPNSDNKNDIFVINGYGLKSLRVSILNNSGKIVHQWNNLHGFWDGKLENGSDAEPGIYFYDIFAETENGTPLTGRNSFVLKR